MDFKAFDTAKIDAYKERAKAEWGSTDAYKEYEKKSRGRTDQEQQEKEQQSLRRRQLRYIAVTKSGDRIKDTSAPSILWKMTT